MSDNGQKDSIWLKLGLFAFIVIIIILVSVLSPDSCNATTFRWSAPTGDPVQYDMRHHVDSATLRSNWSGSSIVPNTPAPSAFGMKDSVTFAVSSSAFFGIKSVDLAGNWSGICLEVQ